MKKSFKSLFYLLICLFVFPCVALAASDFGTLGPGSSASGSFAWWDEAYCEANQTGPFTVTGRESYYSAKDSYYRFVDVKIDDYVDRDYTNVIVTCKARDDINHPITSGRVYSWTSYQFKFNVSAGGQAVPVEIPKTYYLYKGDSVYLTTELGISQIKSFEHSVGRELNTISYSGCSVGSSACTIKFDNSAYAADEGREHRFTIVYVGTNGTLYRSTVTVFESETKKTIDLGPIEPTGTVYGTYLEGVSNFNCSNSISTVPAAVGKDGSGSKYRIKVTNNNSTTNVYGGKTAICTFNMGGKSFEYTYTFTLNANNPVEDPRDYTAYPNDVINIYSDLGIKKIISGTPNVSTSGMTYQGCVANASSCKVTMKSSLLTDRLSTIELYYLDNSNVFKHSTIRITEKSTTIDMDLGDIGVGGEIRQTMGEFTEFSCSAADATKPYTATSYVGGPYQIVYIKNTNTTVNTYSSLKYTCTGKPKGFGDKVFTYNLIFTLGAESTPIYNDKSYELFPGETLNFGQLYSIKNVKSYNYSEGKSANSITVNGCSGASSCIASFTGAAKHNRQHKISLTYVNNSDVLYTTEVTIIEKDPSVTTKAYPGLLGFCQFNSDWEMASWADASGKNYTYYEAVKKGAVLPDCKVDANKNTEKLPLVFKGWTKGYKAGDALTTNATCGTDLLAPGKSTSYGQTYAPCYEMTPHVRVSTNSGSLVNADGFTFRPSDMTYIKVGSSYSEQVKLPDVQYSGFHSSTKLTAWRNTTTGQVSPPGTFVPLDGSVWVAVSDRTVTQVDLYKTVGLNEQVLFTVPDMNSCTLATGSTGYVTIVSSNGQDCTVRGDVVTPFDVYADVLVTLNDGTVRVYKFNVEDRAHINDDDNGIFNVDVDDDIVVGKNDDATLNDYKTDQCQDFLISSEDYKDSKFKYANAKANNGFGEIDMNTGIYKVYQQCSTDRSKYVALCLDPGRRGPNETGTGSANHTFDFYNHNTGKVEKITRKGVLYKKTSDVQKDNEFGQLVMYIVQELPIDQFESNSSDIKRKRAAAHVAVRSMAIYTGFSRDPDPSDQVYASHYYPYMGVADAIGVALEDDGFISDSEAISILRDGYNGNGFKNWDSEVYSTLHRILTRYNGISTDEDFDGFKRTIDETNYTPAASGVGYTINYKGTITAPTGASVTMKSCRNNAAYGVDACHINSFTLANEVDNRKTYNYDVTINVNDASKVVPPSNDEEEKDLSFQLEYTEGHDLVNAFITSASDSSVNVQRMLVISTTNPIVYIYFSVLPNNCDLPVLDATRCENETQCVTNINNKTFNAALFKAAGCCRYQMNESSYIFKSVCSSKCTTSTMTSVCEYVADGKEKADLYEIKEGSQYKGEEDGYQDSIGTCIVNVSDYFVNDGASFLSSVDPDKNFRKYDDVENLINVDQYDTNRYCQVTCKEDWQFSMDSFGNFIGSNAVAAGTYFQIVSNDMFMSGKRTCYTTFINYDRFAANVVDISNELVEAYNRYSRWSHVWTDVDEQDGKTYNSVKYFEKKDSGDGSVCVEYFNKCPQGTTYGDYYWSDEINNCRLVRNYQSGATGSGTTGANCLSKPSTNKGEDYTDGPVSYKTTGSDWNSDATYCSFYRWTCDQYKDAHEEDWMDTSTKTCYYYTYYTKETKTQGTKARGTAAKTDPDGSGPKSPECPSGTTSSNGTCYYSCGTGYYSIGGTCYESTPSGWMLSGGVFYKNCESGWTSYNTAYCRNNNVSSYAASKYELTMDPNYRNETLKCKVWGKGYDFTIKTQDEVTTPNNTDGNDIYYSTEEYDSKASEKFDDRDSIANKGDNNRQNKPVDGIEVKGHYMKEYKHDCQVTAAAYRPGAVGSSSCQVANLIPEGVGLDSYSKTNDMFCDSGSFAVLTDGQLPNAFCRVNTNNNHTDTRYDAEQGYESTDYADETAAFDFIIENFKGHAKKEVDNARFTMQSKYSAIYSHAHDLFNCQNFELRNTSDDKDANRANNPISTDTIMGKKYNYVNIPTQFEPFATYDYDEKMFMDRVVKDDRYLVQYTEKNNGLFSTVSGESGSGTATCTNEFGKSTNCRVDATIETPSGPVETKLSRNYITNSYYNPITPWLELPDEGDANVQVALDRINKYEDPRYTVTTPQRVYKKITFCTVGVINNGTAYMDGKDGEYVAFTSTSPTPKWLGGRCYQATVDYKKVHYVKSSIENSSYYKNKGYWYVRGGDSKIHGDNLTDAINKFNSLSEEVRSGVKFNAGTQEQKRWSRLGSFNVFPISMATPRNLYAYTYSFGNVGSYYDDKLGRIMGNGEQSIIPQNIRTCVYEVYEEVCLCCGYKVEPDEVVQQIAGKPEYQYDMSRVNEAGGNTNGNITFYTNSVSLGDLDLGRDSTTATNWSDNSPFMYNGDEMTTDKGKLLKDNIETTGENIYAREPEYAYYLTPDSLKQIRSYNDAVGYDLNLEKLIVYDVSKIECESSGCKEGDQETINFQHYGSRFLIGDIDGGGIELKSYGTIANSYNNVCLVTDKEYSGSFDMDNKMKSGKCRWVDFVETDQYYYNPTTKQTAKTSFRLSFK